MGDPPTGAARPRRAIRGVVALLVAAALTAAACASPDDDPPTAPDAAPSTAAQDDVSRAAGTPGEEPFTFAVIGDWGSGFSFQDDVADRMCRWREEHPFDLVITTGDNVYDVGSPDRFDEVFFEPYACLLSDGVRFRATLGNHDILTDGGQPQLDEPAFGMKARNYVVREAGVRFVMVDSNRIRWRWIDEHLEPGPGDRWTVVAFHHPVFSAGEHGSTEGSRPGLPRLFRKHGVDLVLNGHDHNYEATKRLQGIRYVVTGGGGAGLRPCGQAWFTDVCRSRHHFLYVRVGRERLKVKAVPRRGEPFHSFRTRGIS